MATSRTADEILSAAIAAVQNGEADLFSALDALPAPIYVTDAEGVVTHFNQACIGFTGRTPTAGKDRWCVTWKLYTDSGEFLPHAECPMAVAIRSKRPVRGVTAVAERPDGTRVEFMPFPTPLFGEGGRLRGAINLLLDVTEARQIEELRRQASRCRRLGAGASDQAVADTLRVMSAEYEAKALELERASQAVRLA
jgi:PAS domain-containing protein